MASIRVRACAGKRERKVKEKISVVQWEGAAASSRAEDKAACGVRVGRARRGTLEQKAGFPPLLSTTLARVHREEEK